MKNIDPPINVFAHTRCDHEKQTATTHFGLKRVVCKTCKKVNVDHVALAEPGVLFRIPRR